MSKRFTATEKWSDPWFRSLSPTAKLLWVWLLDSCDHAGIIEPDLDLARFQIGATDDLQRAFAELGSRLEPIGKKYFVRKFVSFQYGDQLNPANTAHRGVIRRLESAGLHHVVSGFLSNEQTEKNKGPSKDLQSPFEGAQDKDKDKDKDKSKKRSRSESEKSPSQVATDVTGPLPDSWVIPPNLDSPEVRTKLGQFAEMRSRTKKPIKSLRNTSVILPRFEDRDHLLYALDTCIANEYQGLKPDYRPPQSNGRPAQPAPRPLTPPSRDHRVGAPA